MNGEVTEPINIPPLAFFLPYPSSIKEHPKHHRPGAPTETLTLCVGVDDLGVLQIDGQSPIRKIKDHQRHMMNKNQVENRNAKNGQNFTSDKFLVWRLLRFW